jgi:hypothetical protein
VLCSTYDCFVRSKRRLLYDETTGFIRSNDCFVFGSVKTTALLHENARFSSTTTTAFVQSNDCCSSTRKTAVVRSNNCFYSIKRLFRVVFDQNDCFCAFSTKRLFCSIKTTAFVPSSNKNSRFDRTENQCIRKRFRVQSSAQHTIGGIVYLPLHIRTSLT